MLEKKGCAPCVAADAVWLVSGCSSGFGRALADALNRRGDRLIATARRPDQLAFLPAGERVLKAELDVTRPETIELAFAQALAQFGRLDVVVNNAGIGVIGPVEEITESDTRRQFEVNVFGVIAVTRAAQPIFRAQGSGMFINFSSMAGEASIPSLGLYSASKFAVEGLSEAVRDEMAPFGVRVMVVEPGPFDTEWIGRNAVWADRTDTYPEVWRAVEGITAAYADRRIVGDPAKAAAAILAAAALDNPPFRLPLHENSVASTRAKLEAVAADMDRMEPVAREVHYA